MQPGLRRVVGIRQTSRAIRAGRVERLLVAVDAADPLIGGLMEAARAAGIPVERRQTVADLGRVSGIAVGAAAIGILREPPTGR
ncbi:MAG: 50S ribosomal protein L7ae-like protein [Candidatus Limnocylindrales bacterium]